MLLKQNYLYIGKLYNTKCHKSMAKFIVIDNHDDCVEDYRLSFQKSWICDKLSKPSHEAYPNKHETFT